MRIPFKYFTDEIKQEYNIMDIAENVHVYIEIRKGMCCLKILDFNYLVENLATHGYYSCRYKPGLCKQKTRRTTVILCVADFGIKHYNKDDLNYLLNALYTKYEIATNRSGANYIRLTIAWNYEQGHVDISIQD